MKRSFTLLILFLLLAGTAMADQKTAKDYFRLGMQLYSAKDYQGAYYAFEAGLSLDPKNASGYQALGDSLYYAGNTVDAYAAYQKALELNPQNTRLAAFVKTINLPTPVPSATVVVGVAEGSPASDNGKRTVVSADDVLDELRKDSKPKPTATPDLRPPLEKSQWARFYAGYDFALLADLNSGMNALAGTASAATTNTLNQGHGGLLVGAEYGFKLDAGNALSISVENVFTQTQSFSNGVTDLSNPATIFQPSLSPDMVSISANYYAFIGGPKGSRTYFQFGLGLYQAVVSYSGWDPDGINADPVESGSFSSTAFGGTFGIGETFAIGDSFGFDLWARARIVSFAAENTAQLNNDGTPTTNGPYSLAINTGTNAVAVIPSSYIGNGYRNLVLDYSGFDGNVSFNFYF